MRHAQILRRFWHTKQGLVWQDALVVAMLGMSLGLTAIQMRPGAAAADPQQGSPDAGDVKHEISDA